MPTALVLLNVSAAFDTIDHDTLLTCLSIRFGFAGTVLRWFTTYLLDHFQSVKIGSVISKCCKSNFGVPQSSVLGPLLFSLYTPPLSQAIATLVVLQFSVSQFVFQEFHKASKYQTNVWHVLSLVCLDFLMSLQF